MVTVTLASMDRGGREGGGHPRKVHGWSTENLASTVDSTDSLDNHGRAGLGLGTSSFPPRSEASCHPALL